MSHLRSIVVTALCVAIIVAACVPCPAAEKKASELNDPFPPSLEPLRLSLTQSVDRGVAWLAGAQKPDGSMPELWGNNTGIVGLCGKAMLAAGIAPDHPVYGANVVKYLEFILNAQRPDGLFWLEGADTVKGHAFMYAHSISTAFVSECSGMVDEKLQARIDKALPKAIAIILKAQRGGWRYAPSPPRQADLSVTAWCLLALRGARKNGAAVPKTSIDRAVAYVLASRAGDGRFGYLVKKGPWGLTVQMTACGLLSLMLVGRHDDPLNKLSADFILKNVRTDGWIQHTPFWNMPGHREYTLYHGTLALHQMGGRYWETCAQRLFPGIIARQNKDGSWRGGISRPYCTAMHLLSLTAPFEQAPMNQR